jgi:hypothetical protein
MQGAPSEKRSVCGNVGADCQRRYYIAEFDERRSINADRIMFEKGLFFGSSQIPCFVLCIPVQGFTYFIVLKCYLKILNTCIFVIHLFAH